MSVLEATCTAPVNIAVVKYWGKRNTSLILPTNSSISVTLNQDDLKSLTSARIIVGGTGGDRLWLNGIEEVIKIDSRMERCLREMRVMRAQVEKLNGSEIISKDPIHIVSENNFPTAAGLASSASGLSALIATLSTLYSLPTYGITSTQLSLIARQGSGSACRSMFGGYVAWEMGLKEDGTDSFAVQIADEKHWEMKALILVVSDVKKTVASTAGMQTTVLTSDLLQFRIKVVVPKRMKTITEAILAKDFNTFAKETIQDSNQFHAVCLDTYPPIYYLNDVSKAIITLVTEINRVYLENEGRLICAYTFDAGPNAVIYSLSTADQNAILSIVQQYFPQSSTPSTSNSVLPKGFNPKVINKFELGAVSRVIETNVGGGPRVLSTEESLIGVNGLPKTVR